MVRAKLALVAAASLSLLAGCAGFGDHPLFSRSRTSGCCPSGPCFEPGCCPGGDGPIFPSGPVMVPNGGGGTFVVPQPVNGSGGVPLMTDPSRLNPQATATPYKPN